MQNNHLGPLTAFLALPSFMLMASARADTITLPAMPMTQALNTISARDHVQIAYSTPAVKGLTSHPVGKAHTAIDAVKAAIAGTTLAASGDATYIMIYPKATNSLSSDITVVAHRNKAETSNVVDDDPSSNRSGLSLDDQPRSTTVITSEVIAQQQDLTALDALKNAAGVTVNRNTLQGSQTFSVRGFTSSGLVNGLSDGASGGITPGGNLPVASLERIEVLKGPDAMLVGSDELGGTVNLVTKKPTADPLLNISGILGEYGDREASIDASDALTDDKRLSARLILEARKQDENWSGYEGDSEQLINPSLRWKDRNTDLTLTYLNSNQFSGLAPYVVYDDLTNDFLKRPLEPIGPRAQGILVQTNQFSYDLTQNLGKWVTLVSRGQYQHLVNQFSNYSPYAVVDTQGDLLVSPNAGSLDGNNANLDTYLRVKVPIVRGVKLTSSIGFSYNDNFYSNSVASQENTLVIPVVDVPQTETAIPPVDTRSLDLTTSQRGAYYQGVLDLWPVHIVGGVRYNNYVSTSNVYYPYRSSQTSSADAFIPNVGAVWDITKHLSMFVNYAEGYSPVTTTDYEGRLLPDIKTENLEGGFKAKFLNDKLSIISSIFRLKQSVTLAGDPLHPNYDIAEPGKQAIGSDTTIAGQIMPDWTVNASLTYTDYRNLSTSIYGNAVDGSPRLQYSLYTTYIRKLAPKISVGGALGIYGRSNAAVDTTGAIVSPASNEVNVNGLATFGHLSFNLGVVNIFNRRNYDISFTPNYVSVAEPRLWHLTMSYSFF